MKNCLIWGMGKAFTAELMGIRYLEAKGLICVRGITSSFSRFSSVAGYPFIEKENLDVHQFDAVFIMADGRIFKEIEQEAIQMGFSENILIHHRVIHILNNNLDKYLKIKEGRPTIFANNCWGGFAYHSLGLEFNSPLINMIIQDEDYIKFLRNPKHYMESPIEYIGDFTGEDITFPLAKCDDIRLDFVHYTSFEEAKRAWEKRKDRINWDNIFVMFSTENEMLQQEFGRLNYSKKVCFSPYKTGMKQNVYIDFYRKEMKNHNSFGSLVACLASDQYQYMDLIDLLYDGTITKLSKES